MKLTEYPDKRGYFSEFGGRFAPETLMQNLITLEKQFDKFSKNKKFKEEIKFYLKNYAGRPTPLYYAENSSKKLGLKLYIKREDLLHTGAHKINNTIGQALLCKKMGKSRVIAETGAGQHGVATATACALFNLQCHIYMGEKDIQRQQINVFKMKMLGAEVIPVKSGSQTLKDAINEAMRDWITNPDTTHYIIGSVVGPHPYPKIVRFFQSIISEETKKQILKCEGRLPDVLIACVGGGSNASGFFYNFLNDTSEMIGIEAYGDTKKHSASMNYGEIGVFHGYKSLILQDEDGQIKEAHSVAPGLDYPGVGPEHPFLKKIGRAKYFAVTDEIAVEGFKFLSEVEGIIPALEPAHAIGWLVKNKDSLKGKLVVLCLSGRGDKDIDQMTKILSSTSK